MSSLTDSSEEIDLRRLWTTLRKNKWLILGTTVLAAAGSYLAFRSQPPVYEASSTVLAARGETGNSSINSTQVAAPPLPNGAVEEAIHGSILVADIIERIKRSGLPSNQIAEITQDLRQELASDSFSRIKVSSKLDSYFLTGVHTLRASAGSPEAARALANSATESLLAWDLARAAQGVRRARNSYDQQLAALNSSIARAGSGSLERETLISARANVVQSLAQVAVLEQSVVGTLSKVSEAVLPASPVAPRPLRNSILVGLLTLVLSAGAALLRDAFGRKVSSEEDVSEFGLRVLGNLPRLNAKQIAQGMPQVARSGGLYESVGFLRVNLLSSVQEGTRRFVISSSRPGEGKSSVTAALAIGLASSGLRVLLVDADLHRPTQMRIWNQASNGKRQYRPLVGATQHATPALDLPSALERPEAAHVISVAERIDLLAAGNPREDTSRILAHPQLEYLFDRWSSDYDVVLIDTPPILALADTFALARLASGIVMVVEAGQTRVSALERAMQNARNANVTVLGLVLNKVSRRTEQYYYYNGYSRTPDSQEVSTSPTSAHPTS